MAETTLNRLRTLWFNIHLCIGAGLLVLLAPLGLSGVALVWRPELDHMLHPARYVVSDNPGALGPSAYLAAGAAALGPGVTPSRIAYPQTTGAPIVVSGVRAGGSGPPRPINAWLDPATGKALSTGSAFGGVLGLAHDIHEEMLIPGVGRQVVGVLGVAMLIQGLLGIWLWWPRGPFTTALRWRRTVFLGMNLHHLAGILVVIPLAVLSVTGIWMAFPQIGQALSPPPAFGGPGGRPGFPPGGFRRNFGPPLAHPNLSADDALARAQAVDPDSRVAALTVPMTSPRPSWTIQLLPVGAERPVTIRVSDATGEAAESRFGGFGGGFGGPPGGGRDPLSRQMRSIHEGEAGGLVWKLIVTLTGFAPLLLGVTGVIRWWTSRRRPAPSEA